MLESSLLLMDKSAMQEARSHNQLATVDEYLSGHSQFISSLGFA